MNLDSARLGSLNMCRVSRSFQANSTCILYSSSVCDAKERIQRVPYSKEHPYVGASIHIQYTCDKDEDHHIERTDPGARTRKSDIFDT